MNALRSNEKGFILILSMLMLLIITVLVINSVRASTMNEKMSGGYMDRSRAQNLAELALAEGQRSLISSPENAEICRSGCQVTALDTVTEVSVDTAVDLPSAWTADKAITSSNAKAEFVVALLKDDTALPKSRQGKCKAYSIMGQGQGDDARTLVVLQVVAFVCDLDT